MTCDSRFVDECVSIRQDSAGQSLCYRGFLRRGESAVDAEEDICGGRAGEDGRQHRERRSEIRRDAIRAVQSEQLGQKSQPPRAGCQVFRKESEYKCEEEGQRPTANRPRQGAPQCSCFASHLSKRAKPRVNSHPSARMKKTAA